ncbi:MAG: serine/threonine protein kinase [Planctomycetes bacterium]|nr:serine/threonine protein kinase [Planctomycetota bacterium]
METPSAPEPPPAAPAEPWTRLKELVADALELSAAERTLLLDTRCHGAPELRREAEAMLAAAVAATDFLEPVWSAPASVEPLPAGTQLGPFRIEALVGEGGFSEVYRATQQEPFVRQVAIKVLKPGMDSRAVLTRFELERRTLARLEHAGINRILDAGATATGRPFVVMEFVPGLTLARFVAERQPTLAQRLVLFLQVCEAVAHAHQRGVIHRDLKPGNVMVLVDEHGPRAKVIDFGIAKVLGGDAGDLTREGLLLGTPAYASPEQGRAGGDVDTRTDVYTLGVMLAELAGGERRRAGAGGDPSMVSLPRELGWVVAKATRQQREQRYAGVPELAADVRAFVAGEALAAGPATGRYRLQKFVRRHRGACVAAAFVLFAWLAGGIVAWVSYYRAELARQEADAARRDADVTVDYLARLIAEADPRRQGRDVRVVDLLERSEPLLAKATGDVANRLHQVVGRAYDALGEFAAAERHLRAAADGYAAAHGGLDWRGIEVSGELLSVLAHAGRIDDAAAMLDGVAARATMARGTDHPLARTVVLLRAMWALVGGGVAAAAAPLRELLRLEQRDGDAAGEAVVLGNLSQVLLAKGGIAEARALATRGRELSVRLHGAADPRSLAAARKLAAACSGAGDHAATMALLQPLRQLAYERLGADHPDALGIDNYLAHALQRTGDLAAARTIYAELVPRQQQKLGRLHAQAVMTLFNFACLLEEQHDLAAAEPLLRDAYRRFHELRGPVDRDTLHAGLVWLRVRSAQGFDVGIAADFAAAVAAMRSRLGAGDGLVREADAAWLVHLRRLAAARRAAGDAAAAAAACSSAFVVATRLGDDVARREVANALAAAAQQAGDEVAAARWRDAAR